NILVRDDSGHVHQVHEKPRNLGSPQLLLEPQKDVGQLVDNERIQHGLDLSPLDRAKKPDTLASKRASVKDVNYHVCIEQALIHVDLSECSRRSCAIRAIIASAASCSPCFTASP